CDVYAALLLVYTLPPAKLGTAYRNWPRQFGGVTSHAQHRGAALNLLPARNGLRIQCHPDAWCRGQRQLAVLWAQTGLWCYQALEIVDVLLEHKVFHGETISHRSHQMHVHISMPVRRHGEIKGGGGMRHFEPFGDAAQHTGIGLQDIGCLLLDEGAEV